ncbi:hypothetical protein QQ045_003781 [Rhodiola kirilowii]
MSAATRSSAAQDHVIAERKRSEKLSQRFIALSAVVPGHKKTLWTNSHILVEVVYVQVLGMRKGRAAVQRRGYNPSEQVVYPNERFTPVQQVVSPTSLISAFQNKSVDEFSAGIHDSVQHEASLLKSDLVSPWSWDSRQRCKKGFVKCCRGARNSGLKVELQKKKDEFQEMKAAFQERIRRGQGIGAGGCDQVHIKQLQERAKILEDQTKSKTVESVVLMKRSKLVIIDGKNKPSSFSNETSIEGGLDDDQELPEIEARVCNKDVLIRVHWTTRKVSLGKFLGEMSKLHFMSVVNTNVLAFGSSAFNVTIVAQMDAECCMTVKEIAKTLRAAFVGFM